MIQKRVLLAIRRDNITPIAVSTVYEPVQEPQVLLTIRLIDWPSTLQWLLPRLSRRRTHGHNNRHVNRKQSDRSQETIAKQQAGGKVLIYERSHSEWERESWSLTSAIDFVGELNTFSERKGVWGTQDSCQRRAVTWKDPSAHDSRWDEILTVHWTSCHSNRKIPEGEASLHLVNKRSWRAGKSRGIGIKPKWSLGHLGHSEQVNLMCQKPCRHTAGVPAASLKAAFDVITASGRCSVAYFKIFRSKKTCQAIDDNALFWQHCPNCSLVSTANFILNSPRRTRSEWRSLT